MQGVGELCADFAVHTHQICRTNNIISHCIHIGDSHVHSSGGLLPSEQDGHKKESNTWTAWEFFRQIALRYGKMCYKTLCSIPIVLWKERQSSKLDQILSMEYNWVKKEMNSVWRWTEIRVIPSFVLWVKFVKNHDWIRYRYGIFFCDFLCSLIDYWRRYAVKYVFIHIYEHYKIGFW